MLARSVDNTEEGNEEGHGRRNANLTELYLL